MLVQFLKSHGFVLVTCTHRNDHGMLIACLEVNMHGC